MPLGVSHPDYELYLVKVDNETGEVHQIMVSTYALKLLSVGDYEWKESNLKEVDDNHKVVRKPVRKVKENA